MKYLRNMADSIKAHPALWAVGLLVPSFASLASSPLLACAMETFTEIMTGVDPAVSRLTAVMGTTAAALEHAGLSADFLPLEAGARGEQLSGSQRQRVAIARALLRSAPLIILDEPTASLDEAAEQSVLDTIRHIKTLGTSVLLITHRDTTANVADRRVVMGAK